MGNRDKINMKEAIFLRSLKTRLNFEMTVTVVCPDEEAASIMLARLFGQADTPLTGSIDILIP